MRFCVILHRLIVCCLLLPFWCAAVEPYIPVVADPILEPWRWRQEETLAGLGVLCMDEAEDGTLWFGNTGSIAHYDGMNVTTIPFDDDLLSNTTHERASPWANSLIVLRDGNVLVLIGESLVLRANNTWKVIIKDAGPSVFTAHMEQAENGTVWLIVPGALWRIEEDMIHASVVMEASGKNQLLSFCIDSAGSIWVVEKTGEVSSRLIKIPVSDGRPAARSEWREFPVPFNNDKSEADIIAGENGLIWYTAKATTGVEAFDSRRGEWIQRKSGVKSQRYYSLLKSCDGSIWAGGESKILRVSFGKEILYPVEELKLPMLPMSLFKTGTDRIWVIGRIGSVYSVDIGSREWKTYKGLNYQCETTEGLRWFTSTMHRGVVSQNLNTGEWLRYDPKDGLIDSTLTIIQSSQGLIWAVGSHNGRAAFSVFNGVRWKRFCHPDMLRRFEPTAVLEAADGTMWLGTGGDIPIEDLSCGGVVQYKVNPDRSVELLSRHSPPDFPYYVTALAQTPDRVLWVGSTFVYRYDGVSSQAQPTGVLQGTRSISMMVDSNQTVWVAKDCFGVCHWQGDSWKVFGIDDGIPSLNLRGLCLLNDGSIMASSDKGISRFDGKAWTANAYPEWFRMIQRKSAIKQAGDGALWFNYVDNEPQFAKISIETGGFCTVRHQPETDPPETLIASCLKRIAPPGNCHIIWSGHDLWSVTPAEDLQYSWRLDGGAWSAFSHEKGRTFLALVSGGHTLEVRARDQAFNIDPTPARVEFTVIPPIWRQGWFLTMVFFFVGLILLLTWLLLRNRERYLLERQAEHEAFLVAQQKEHEKNLIERQAEHEAFLVAQQKENEKNLIERQAEREALLVKQQEEREKNLVERQAEREKHLVEIDRLKTGFFTNISHELRTPLTVILGPLEMMLKAEADPKKRNVLSLMVRNAQRVATLITQLLDFRKLEEGKIGIDATYGDMVPVVTEVVTALRPLAENARISCFMEGVTECRGWFDLDKLQKIFTNLIANSIKYTKAGGEIRVSLTTASFGSVSDHETGCKNKLTGRYLKFVVEDTGVGISQEHLEHIFERFYRVSETSMAVGAGIGLNLTKELVDLLGGEIHAESPIHPDENRPGTRFTVCLPIDRENLPHEGFEKRKNVSAEVPGEPDIAMSSDPVPPESLGDEKEEKTDAERHKEMPIILVVEDDEDIREFIVEGLKSSFHVEIAGNGEAALRIAKEQVPDLIVTDLMMPVMDGLTLCRELKTSMETSHIPVVMLTAKASLEHQVEGLENGADDYITKPFQLKLLQVRIANLLESRRVLREKFLRQYPVLTPQGVENTSEKEFLKAMTSVLAEYYADWSFGPETFSAAMGMSRCTLQRKMKAVTDRTPAGFINEYRMMKAAEMLLSTSNTVTEIGFDAGCEDSGNFSRMFKKHYGMSPSKYRETHQSP